MVVQNAEKSAEETRPLDNDSENQNVVETDKPDVSGTTVRSKNKNPAVPKMRTSRSTAISTLIAEPN